MSLEAEFEHLGQTTRAAIDHAFARHALSFKTGIDFIDDATGGIYQDDLILLGAATGRGKTQLSTIIAVNAARAGKRVAFFALEAAPKEIQRRIVSMKMSLDEAEGFNYRRGIMTQEMIAKQDRAVSEIEKENLPIYIQYKKGDFGADELSRTLTSMSSFADLFIIDHFHFIDHEGSRSEHEGHKKTIKTLRDLALLAGKPILLIAHMNKAYGKNQGEIPTIYDFYGTADLGNVCTKAITLTTKMPDWIDPVHTHAEMPTIMHIAKNREESSTNRYAAVCSFDVSNNRYKPGYHLFDYQKKIRVTKADAPAWASHLKIDRPYETGRGHLL